MPIAEFSNWLRRVIWDSPWTSPRNETVKQCRRQMTVANSPVQLFIFGIFEHKWGTRKHIDDLKKYSWCIPVQKEIKPIIWGAAVTPEPWNRQQCWFIFEDPNVRVARLLESLATMTTCNLELIEAPHNVQHFIYILHLWSFDIIIGIFIPPASTKLKGGYTGITLSVCSSVCLWTELCPLCIFNNTHQIHFIFAHLIKQLQKVCRV